MDIPKSRQSPLGSHCGGVYTPEIVTQEGGQHLLTRDNLWLFERLTRALGDEKMVGFCFRQDVTQHGHQDLDEAKICISFFLFCISLCIYFGSSRSSCELLPDFPIKGHLKLASSHVYQRTDFALPARVA